MGTAKETSMIFQITYEKISDFILSCEDIEMISDHLFSLKHIKSVILEDRFFFFLKS